MRYNRTVPGIFLDRPNRFIAHVELDGKTETVHVKNTGRCRELLQPGARVWLAVSDNPSRKTGYDLVCVEKQRPGREALLVNMDSQLPNDAVEEWLRSGHFCPEDARIQREVTYGRSRFDFYLEDGARRIFLEVKGVTLEQDGVASFPDAPTERGTRHLRELAASLEAGYEAWVLFVVQMQGIRYLCPADAQDPVFGNALREAVRQGVRVLAVDCAVTPDSMTLCRPILVRL